MEGWEADRWRSLKAPWEGPEGSWEARKVGFDGSKARGPEGGAEDVQGNGI